MSLATLSSHLGLSKAAISRVLNRAPAARSIPPATQQRILDAARELNYRPNLLARSLRRGQSHSIGVLVPELSEGYATLVLAGLEETLSAAGYVFLLIMHHHRESVLLRSRDMFLERAVDGIVAIDTVMPPHGLTPSVTVSCPDPHESVTNIVLDHHRAAGLALEHLHQLGHRRVAVIQGQPFSSDTEPRWRSIKAAARRLGISIRPECVVQLEGDDPTDAPGYQAGQRLLAQGTDFTALFCFNDVSAMGAMRAMREAGIETPRDVSVIGFDDVRFAAYHSPALTTVRQPLHKMGCLAAESVLRRVGQAGAEPGPPRIVVEPSLIVRQSTAAPRPGAASAS